MEKYYVAYGSNLNLSAMKKICPNSKPLIKGIIKNYCLVFKGIKYGYLTIEPKDNSYVPVLLWQIAESDWLALDKYEDYPRLYRKEEITVISNEQEVKVIVYLMNDYPTQEPTTDYLKICQQGYQTQGFDLELLNKALLNIKKDRN